MILIYFGLGMHKPGLKKSNITIGNSNNQITINRISPEILITTEVWDENNLQPWSFKNYSSSKIFKLIMKWEEGKNYAITKVIDDENNLIYYYCDICSPITKSRNVFEFNDWYLDVLKLPNKDPELLDQNEFEAAVQLRYLASQEVVIAEDTVKKVIELLKDERVSFEF